MTSFYIASGVENALKAQHLMELLRHLGQTITYDWTKIGSLGNADEKAYTELLDKELRGIVEADVVIVLLPGGRSTHCELAYAISRSKRIYLLGDMDDGWGRKSVWYHHPCVHKHLDWSDWDRIVGLMKELRT